MVYVAVMSIVFVIAGFGMLYKFGAGNSAALEAATARSNAERRLRLGVAAPHDPCLTQLEDAIKNRR